MLLKKKCKNCKTTFYRKVSPCKAVTTIFCSHKCQAVCSFKNLDRSFLKNEGNGLWKGNKVGNKGLHAWVRRKFNLLGHKVKCEFGSCSKISQKIELSNKTGVYNRDLKNWWYLCKICHNIYDKVGYKVWKVRRKKFGKTGGNLKGKIAFSHRKRDKYGGKFIK